jgi:hypothetical protein
MTAGNFLYSDKVMLFLSLSLSIAKQYFLNVCKYIFRYQGATRINALFQHKNMVNDPLSLKNHLFAYLRLDMHWIPRPLL